MGPGDVCIHDKLYTMVILVIILVLIITIILLVFFIYYTMDFCLRTMDRRLKRRKYPGAENCQSGPQHQHDEEETCCCCSDDSYVYGKNLSIGKTESVCLPADQLS